MPELPEVETVRLGLAPFFEHQTITKAEARRSGLRVPFPPDFAKRLTGTYVRSLRRRAKYLLAELDSGETLVIHLGMSGRMSVLAEAGSRKLGRYIRSTDAVETGGDKHDHVVFETTAPARIVFTDPRRFGLMLLASTEKLGEHPIFVSLGPEPLSKSFNPVYLTRNLAHRRTPIKVALLDQAVVSGLGNIYVCEALFHAGISPCRLAGDISKGAVRKLVVAVKQTLREAICAGGSTLRDHQRVNGELGKFQHRFAVYGRDGKPCLSSCGKSVERIVLSGRSTFYCPRCQR